MGMNQRGIRSNLISSAAIHIVKAGNAIPGNSWSVKQMLTHRAANDKLFLQFLVNNLTLQATMKELPASGKNVFDCAIIRVNFGAV